VCDGNSFDLLFRIVNEKHRKRDIFIKDRLRNRFQASISIEKPLENEIFHAVLVSIFYMIQDIAKSSIGNSAFDSIKEA
jgi:hypothetical protein